jgi:hypothetical protein
MSHFESIHLLLAYVGLAIHVILKLAQLPGSLFENITKKDILVVLASIISIPVILIVCSDTTMKEFLPINNVTAFLAGYQTQSFLKTFSNFTKKVNKQE